MKLYKLTDARDQTRGGCQWGEGVTHTAPGDGPLCSAAWIHAYTDPILAVMMDPSHGRYNETGYLWEAEGNVGLDDGTKVGCTRLTTLRRIPMPEVSPKQRIRFAILAAQAVCKDPDWNLWAAEWLSGMRHSSDKVKAVMEAVRAAGFGERFSGEKHVYGALAAAAASTAAYRAVGPRQCNSPAMAASHASEAAIYASEAATHNGATLDLAALARQATASPPTP